MTSIQLRLLDHLQNPSDDGTLLSNKATGSTRSFSAQTMEEKYKQSTNLAKRIKDAYVERTVNPQWIGSGDVFWYRCDTKPGKHCFVTVNPELGTRRPSFDHERLASALNNRCIRAQACSLPFTCIDLTSDGASVKFRIGGEKWEFRDDEILVEYDEEFSDENLAAIHKEKPSEREGSSTVIKFINQTKGPVSLFWIDWDGQAIHYATFDAGASNLRHTYSGHVWRVVKAETNEPIASYVARTNDSIVIIKEPMGPTQETTNSYTKECIDMPSRSRASIQSVGAQQQSVRSMVRDYNVWIHDSIDQRAQLSTSGTADSPFDGTLYPSPNDRFIVAWQYTPQQEHTVYQIESSPKDQLQPRLKQFQYLKPGDKIRIDRPRMFDVSTMKEITTDDTLFQNPYEIVDMGWSLDGSEYRFRFNQRGHQILRVIGMSVHGAVRTMVEEESTTFIDHSAKTYAHEIEGCSELVWASERDGWNHLYLYDINTGKVKNRITEGNWNVQSVEGVDEKTRRIWFRALGVIDSQDPYYAQLVRVNLDGSGFTTLTKGDGTHTWKWSPDEKYLVDTWSRVDMAPQTALRDGESGEVIAVLEEEGNLDSLRGSGWTTPERFATPGRDGTTMIYGIIIRPFDWDSNAKYPVIEQIYAGPTDFSVPKAFSLLTQQHELAELGFIVVQIDGMGTNWRSKPFHDRCYKDLKDAGLPDRIAWIKAAAESRPWMDTTRVGIYGSSAGGQNAMAALLWHGDFYKAAVADCGCHDNRLDKLWWNEQWMGWPVDEQYAESSNAVHAGRLKGALMLIVGELDQNVDSGSTLQVVNALNEAEKDYDLLYMPGYGHGIGSSNPYAVRRQRDFFVRHLLGIEPPKRNDI
ncbi:MAG: hypothetical protein MMC23_003134 [Stictis urceolatum]|nr:hypothetical protein [Stictis urceolata]